MATKRFNITFEGGAEYEATIYYSGAVKIRNDSGHVVFENGLYTTRDVMQILEALKDEIESKDPEYQDWIEETEEVERMDGEELTLIMNYPCRFHSVYKGWELYRAWDIVNDHGRMLYFASGFTPSGGLTILQAGNLSGIKKRVSEVA